MIRKEPQRVRRRAPADIDFDDWARRDLLDRGRARYHYRWAALNLGGKGLRSWTYFVSPFKDRYSPRARCRLGLADGLPLIQGDRVKQQHVITDGIFGVETIKWVSDGPRRMGSAPHGAGAGTMNTQRTGSERSKRMRLLQAVDFGSTASATLTLPARTRALPARLRHRVHRTALTLKSSLRRVFRSGGCTLKLECSESIGLRQSTSAFAPW